MYEHLLLLVIVVQGMTLLRVLRRSDGEQRGYAFVVAGVAVLAGIGLGRGERFWGTIGIALSVLTVIVPWVLEAFSRWAFGRGNLSIAVRAAALRGMLMPGAGLARQQQILHGIGLLEREGVDAALGHFRELAQATEDGGELALIHEQIVSMLFYGQRWDEGIAHYERRFHPGYAAMRPGLALGLLRAYGESHRLERAAGLLRALEEGPVGADPRSAEMLGQARITFLAYAGAASVLDEVITGDRVRDLGISPATGALYHGIALARAGDPERAEAALRRVESLAGPRDQRVLDASRTTLGRVMEATVDLEPELTHYVHSVASRLRRFLDTAPVARPRGPLVATFGIMIGFAFAYGLWLLRDRGGIAILELGAMMPQLWASGGWYRLFTAPWLHVDVITLMFDIYAVWLAGHMVEQVYGSARAAFTAIGGALVGLLAGLWLNPYSMMAMAAGNLMVVSMIVAALWTLLPSRSPALSDRARRTLGVTLVLLFIANLLASLPSFLGLDFPPVALLAAGAWGTATSLGLPVSLPRVVTRGLGAVVVGALLVTGYAGGMLAREDPEQSLIDARTQTCTLSQVELHVPPGFEWTRPDLGDAGFAVPGFDGVTDMLALQAGDLVQVAVIEAEGTEDQPALVVAQPELARQFGITRAPDEAPIGWPSAGEGTTRRAWELRRNGEVVAQLVERPLARGDDRVTLMMLASPGVALTHTPRLYAAIFEEAAYAPESAGDRCDREP